MTTVSSFLFISGWDTNESMPCLCPLLIVMCAYVAKYNLEKKNNQTARSRIPSRLDTHSRIVCHFPLLQALYDLYVLYDASTTGTTGFTCCISALDTSAAYITDLGGGIVKRTWYNSKQNRICLVSLWGYTVFGPIVGGSDHYKRV